jgi:ribosomal protein S27E
MLERCPECNSEQIICKHLALTTKSCSWGEKILDMLRNTMTASSNGGIPEGEYYFECKQCGKKGIIRVN